MEIMSFFPLTKAKAKTKKKVLGGGGCEQCGLYRTCHTPRMEATGDGEKGIFVLAEAPGAEEDAKGVQLVGQSGRLLRRELSRLGIDLDRDCRKMNAVNCRPPENATPTDLQVACCRQRVLAEIERFKPKAILALGKSAMYSLAQHRCLWDKGFPNMTQWQGARIPDQDFLCWIVPTWHPAFILRMENVKEMQYNPAYINRFRDDIKAAVSLADVPVEKKDYFSMVSTPLKTEKAVDFLNYLISLSEKTENFHVAFDYETTGLKPYAEGHKCYCVSFGYKAPNGAMRAFSFLLNEATWPKVEYILRSRRIGKYAHNMKFEHLWSKVRGGAKGTGFTVQNWQWDSMLAAHILDNRKGITGLKFQTYINFGVLGYDDDVSPYLKGKKPNAINDVADAPVKNVLLYCAYDSLFEYMLAEKQRKLILKDDKLSNAYSLFHKGALAFVEMEKNGFRIDLDYCKEQEKELSRQIEEIKVNMDQYDEIKLWKEMTGSKFNLNSVPQLRALLKKLGVTLEKKTAKGEDAVDKEVLENLPYQFGKDILHIRNLEKIQGTYIKNMVSEVSDGVLHPFFHLHGVISYRSSSADPNFQNIPKRDKEAQKIVRRAIRPKEGFMWAEVDYSGVEVKVSACYHKDPTMIAYLKDPTSDMHRDVASDLFLLPKDKITKPLRQGGKNGFVFPQFYGDYYGHNAPRIWRDWVCSPSNGALADGSTVKEHLAKKGIRTVEKFTEHVKKVEERFWGERFLVYDRWKDAYYNEYLKHGYFYSYLGFKYTSIMNKKDATNYGVQGTAFHCLLHSLIKVVDRLKKCHFKSFVVGQIHDAINMNIWPDEANEVIPMMREIMVNELVRDFTWINVPMDVEFDLGPVSGSWYEVKETKRRPVACECGMEWGWENKDKTWECPVCRNVS